MSHPNGNHGPSPEQREVIDSWGQGLAVIAGAGSGKTTTLVSKCLDLIQRDPESKILAVSFTEKSAADLRAKLSGRLIQQGKPEVIHHHWVMTIHGLCGAIVQEFPREAGLDGEERVLDESEAQLLWESILDRLWTEEIPEIVANSLNLLLDRESQSGLSDLLRRSRELSSFGALEFLRKSLDPSSIALVRVAEFVIDQYSHLKRRRGVIDFNDLEICADRALNSPQVQEVYRRRFKLVLVDEFQDTNPIQASLVWRLAQPGGANLCVVGDPKQSIYRFRDADVTVFDEFCARLPVQKSLTWNFRSRPGIIEFSNQICEPAFQASQMQFEALVPQRPPRADLAPVIKVRIETPSQLAKWILAENQNGVALDEMALLVRRVRGNEPWFKALTASGIPIAFGSGGLFWDDPRVRELVAFLRWWTYPANRLSGAVFLRASWVGISDQTLDQWFRQDETFCEPFFNSDYPLARELKVLRGTSVRPGELLLALLGDPDREAELWAPLMGLWHRVEEYSSQGLEWDDVIREVSRAVEEKRRDREVPAPRQLGQLRVLTFHGAKGLEFDHVILIDFPEKPRASDAPLLFWDRREGAYLGARDEDGMRDRKNPTEQKWRELEKQKNLAESKRIFYVALTRARERLILACLDSDFETPSEPDRATLYLEDHWRNWIEHSGVQLPEIRVQGKVASQGALKVAQQQKPTLNLSLEGDSGSVELHRARHSPTEWSLLARCPRAYEWTVVRPKAPQEKPSQGLQDLGTRVHQCLQYGKYSELEQIESEVGPEHLNAKMLTQWAGTSPWMRPSDLASGREVWRELAFEVPILGEVLVGSLDRLVWEQERCQYSIIDFKVGQKRKSPRWIVQSYTTQIQLYALAVQTLEAAQSPETQGFQINARIIHISPEGVQEAAIPVDLEKGLNFAKTMVTQSRSLISGASGQPQPGGHCLVCPHQKSCPESVVDQEAQAEFEF